MSETVVEKPKRKARWQTVEHATFFPTNCLICQSNKGPFVDTERDWQDFHIYICRKCMKDGAESMGFVKGERLDQLENAADEVTRLEQAVKAAEAQCAKLGQSLEEAKRTVVDQSAVLQQTSNERAQEKHLLGQIKTAASQL